MSLFSCWLKPPLQTKKGISWRMFLHYSRCWSVFKGRVRDMGRYFHLLGIFHKITWFSRSFQQSNNLKSWDWHLEYVQLVKRRFLISTIFTKTKWRQFQIENGRKRQVLKWNLMSNISKALYILHKVFLFFSIPPFSLSPPLFTLSWFIFHIKFMAFWRISQFIVWKTKTTN